MSREKFLNAEGGAKKRYQEHTCRVHIQNRLRRRPRYKRPLENRSASAGKMKSGCSKGASKRANGIGVMRGRLTKLYFTRAELCLAEQGPHALAFCNSGRAFLGRVLRPLQDLLQANLMLGWVAIHDDGELGHRARARRTHMIFPKAGDANRDGFVEALGVYVDAMENAFAVGEGDPATRT
jgi:hypothetical protein